MRFLVTDGACVMNAQAQSRMREMVIIVTVGIRCGI